MIKKDDSDKSLEEFLSGKSEHTLALFHHFIKEYKKIGNVTLHPARTITAWTRA